MSSRERERLKLFERVKRGELLLREVAQICGLSYRQTRRLYKRYCADGDRGLLHRGRGRPSNRAYPAAFKASVLARYQEKYPDFGPTLAAEKLVLEGHVVDHKTLRGWLLKEGLWQKRRKRGKHRSWRERRAHFGELVQLDGSHHQWFEKRAPKACLMNMVDDAQGTTLSWLAEEETIFAAMQLLWQWIDSYGIPQSLYTDKKNVSGECAVMILIPNCRQARPNCVNTSSPLSAALSLVFSSITSLASSNPMCHQQIINGAVFALAKDRLGLAEPKATQELKGTFLNS